MLDLGRVFEGGKKDSRAVGLGPCLSRAAGKSPLMPETLQGILVPGLWRGIVGRSDFLPGGCLSDRKRKNCLALLPRL